MDTSKHKNLASGHWQDFTFFEQMANIGVDVSRAINSNRDNNLERGNQAFERSLELLDLTIDDPKNKRRLRELLRLREVLVDYFYGNNEFLSTPDLWNGYFMPFNFAARSNC